jgi:hypothetical protein
MPRPYMTPSMIRTCLASMGMMVAIATSTAAASQIQGPESESRPAQLSADTENSKPTHAGRKGHKHSRARKHKSRRSK